MYKQREPLLNFQSCIKTFYTYRVEIRCAQRYIVADQLTRCPPWFNFVGRRHRAL